MTNTSKLPKWARDHIAALERSIAYHEEQARKLAEGQTRVTYGYVHDGQQRFMPDMNHYRFDLSDDHGRKYVDISLQPDEGHGDKRLVLHGSDMVAVMPTASNSLAIRVLSFAEKWGTR